MLMMDFSISLAFLKCRCGIFRLFIGLMKHFLSSVYRRNYRNTFTPPHTPPNESCFDVYLIFLLSFFKAFAPGESKFKTGFDLKWLEAR